VLYRDISYNNVFLNKELNAKLGDFTRARISSLVTAICPIPNTKIKGISIRSKVFTLNSTFYKIIIGLKLYKELLD
ncbi:uncharacterized protein K441DRAFT_546761, partial [Cenococcum geophilum 1.58]|uniref:uncharacterized protein n=1 Tax=Cenococcum geophilum 1.58 TaxID=794803 RepID=UPI00358F93DE